ncbi:(Fe-S)-binding protein [Caldalkalibacillus mannanilyticus]|uniref:(Fe-S)-binding protein n=1 Tax=Caldalkalibacillus mannanilyticus TaxID=1418 RepID=UPI000A4E3617
MGKSVVDILRSYGCEVIFPEEQTCCGQPAYNSGYHWEAKRVAQQLIRAFEQAEYVVSPSGSCTAMIRHYYPILFSTDEEWREKAQLFANKTFEFSEFLVKVVGTQSLKAEYEGVATYHHSCHMMRGLRLYEEPIQLLHFIQRLKVHELPYEKDCCGFGGTFAVKMEQISEQMVTEKVQHIVSTGANILVGSDMACLMNIEGRLRRLGYSIKAYHVAELINEGVKRYESNQSTSLS